jgi:hypothetical protein
MASASGATTLRGLLYDNIVLVYIPYVYLPIPQEHVAHLSVLSCHVHDMLKPPYHLHVTGRTKPPAGRCSSLTALVLQTPVLRLYSRHQMALCARLQTAMRGRSPRRLIDTPSADHNARGFRGTIIRGSMHPDLHRVLWPP